MVHVHEPVFQVKQFTIKSVLYKTHTLVNIIKYDIEVYTCKLIVNKNGNVTHFTDINIKIS